MMGERLNDETFWIWHLWGGFGAALKLYSRCGLLPCSQEGKIRALSSLDM